MTWSTLTNNINYKSPLGTHSYKRQFKIMLDFLVTSVISRDSFSM